MELTGYYRLHNSAQKDNCIKLRWIILNDNNQVSANMATVGSLLNVNASARTMRMAA